MNSDATPISSGVAGSSRNEVQLDLCNRPYYRYIQLNGPNSPDWQIENNSIK